MKSVRVRVVTPLGEFYSQSAEVSDDYTGDTDEEFYQSVCKGMEYYQMGLENGASVMYLPKEIIQQSIFIVEVRKKGEEEL